MNTDFSKDKVNGVFRSWIFLESFKIVSFAALYFFPDFGHSYAYYLIFLLFIVTVYSLYKTFPYFKFCFSRSIFEEYEARRLVFAKNRNYLFFIMCFDIIPFLIFPQLIFRIVFWRRTRRFTNND